MPIYLRAIIHNNGLAIQYSVDYSDKEWRFMYRID